MARKRRLRVSFTIESDGKHYATFLGTDWMSRMIAGPGSIWKMSRCRVVDVTGAKKASSGRIRSNDR